MRSPSPLDPGVSVRRFSFRFDAVKRQRDATLDAAKGALAAVLDRHARHSEHLADRRLTLQRIAADGPRPPAPLDPRRERIRQLHLHALRDDITRAEAELALIETELADARATVAEAHRRLRAIERLEERDREAWREDVTREEQKEADERSAQRHKRG